MNDINNILYKLSLSKFRSSFKLSKKDILYVNDKGIDVIERHAFDFINNRIKPSVILNDGKQTPFKGHPVFISQHATGTCCRECLYKWHHISKDRELSYDEVCYVVNVIMTWIKRQCFK